jgi:hypothetical protein
LGEAGVGHRLAVEETEAVEVEAKGAVVAQIEEVIADQFCEAGLTVRSEAHELVLAGIDAEAAVVGER